jgi:hypothetical protein
LLPCRQPVWAHAAPSPACALRRRRRSCTNDALLRTAPVVVFEPPPAGSLEACVFEPVRLEPDESRDLSELCLEPVQLGFEVLGADAAALGRSSLVGRVPRSAVALGWSGRLRIRRGLDALDDLLWFGRLDLYGDASVRVARAIGTACEQTQRSDGGEQRPEQRAARRSTPRSAVRASLSTHAHQNAHITIPGRAEYPPGSVFRVQRAATIRGGRHQPLGQSALLVFRAGMLVRRAEPVRIAL